MRTLTDRSQTRGLLSRSGRGQNRQKRVLTGRYARRSAGGVVSWFLVDKMGSTVALTDVSGNIQTTYTYGPFGQTAAAGATNDNPYQFHGREAEPMTGLLAGMYYFRARYLDTGLSRFVSRDPAGFQGGGHLYNYGGNAPTMFTDPTGMEVIPGISLSAPVPGKGWQFNYNGSPIGGPGGGDGGP